MTAKSEKTLRYLTQTLDRPYMSIPGRSLSLQSSCDKQSERLHLESIFGGYVRIERRIRRTQVECVELSVVQPESFGECLATECLVCYSNVVE